MLNGIVTGKRLYWFLLLIVFIFQAYYSLQTTNQIRREEVAESIRNVYWLDQGSIYDGVSSNIGWYGSLLLVYKTFGFTLFTAKFFRLLLHLLSLFCLAEIFRRLIGYKMALLPVSTIGLSPTLLFFNTLQTSFGIDLQYTPIAVFLLYTTKFRQQQSDIVKIVLFWFIVMLACMSYPSFVLYIPSLLLIYIYMFIKNKKDLSLHWIIYYVLASLSGFFLPLIISIIYLNNPEMLLYDPNVNAGLFRGGGQVSFDFTIIRRGVMTTIEDLLGIDYSFYYELRQSDFSTAISYFSLISSIITFITIGCLNKTNRVVFLSILLLFVLSLFIPNLSLKGMPGIRRCTGILTAIYAMYSINYLFFTHHNPRQKLIKYTGILLCLIIPVNHTWSYMQNIKYTDNESKHSFKPWLSIKETPQESLWYLLEETNKSRTPLICFDIEKNRPIPCRYSEVFAMLSGYRIWNNLENVPIQAYDWRSNRYITLNADLWNSYYFPH